MNYSPDQTLAQIVTQQHQAAHIFEKYDLDFCCKGKRSLSSACAEKGIPVDELLKELNEPVKQAPKEEATLFENMSAAELISHIITHHHFYVKQYAPTIKEHLDRVAFKHGDKYPWMKEVASNFTVIYNDFIQHMQKEEIILFPRIEKMAKSEPGTYPSNFISGPIAVMEAEHEQAGGLMARIKELTNGYTWPETACTTFRISMLELKEFEENLHQHVHLENNVLFPKALEQ